MYKIVLIRHGESVWNKENLFTGWTDVDLSEKGLQEAKEAGVLLKQEGFNFDLVYTSVLKRAIRTTWNVLDQMDLMWIPVEHDWRLNERHYGALQLRRSAAGAHCGRSALSGQRSAIQDPDQRATASDRVPEGYGGTRYALVA